MHAHLIQTETCTNNSTTIDTHASPRTTRVARLWFIALVSLTALAFVGHWLFPFTPDRVAPLLAGLGLHAHVGSHHFVDTRVWLGIPNSADVLSNLPFAVFGLFGLLQLGQIKAVKNFGVPVLSRIQTQAFALFFVGLLLTTLGSSLYHLAPSDNTLLWDRAGMAVAFAGVLGIAASERISHLSGRFALRLSLVGAALALWVWSTTGDVLPWSVVQFGGIALVLGLTQLKPIDGSLGVSLRALIAYYALAKGFESTDHAVFELTQHWVSGHSLKHLIASLAALPVLLALAKLRKNLISA